MSDFPSGYFYVDGEKVRTVTLAGDIIVIEDGQNYVIGASNGAVTFDGLIDEVRVYNRALSADEVKRLYNLGR